MPGRTAHNYCEQVFDCNGEKISQILGLIRNSRNNKAENFVPTLSSVGLLVRFPGCETLPHHKLGISDRIKRNACG